VNCKIGIPRALYYFHFFPLWETFLAELGFEPVVSPPTNQDILQRGLSTCVESACLPLKAFVGHATFLVEQGLDLLFVPQVISVFRKEYTYKRPMIVSVVTSDVSDDCNSLAVPETGIYLRVTRFDNCFALHYSHDAKWWEMVRYFRLDSPGPVKVGVVAQSPTGNGCTVTFDHLLYSSEPVRDIRSGR
jgi:hypothetical protein